MIAVMSKRVALYLRVSTTEQTVENQQRELEAVAERHGWNVVAVFTDAGISGTKGRDKRPGYDCLCRGIARRGRLAHHREAGQAAVNRLDIEAALGEQQRMPADAASEIEHPPGSARVQFRRPTRTPRFN